MKSFIKRYSDVLLALFAFVITFFICFFSFSRNGFVSPLGEVCITSACFGACLVYFSWFLWLVSGRIFSFIARKLRHGAGKKEA